MNDQVLLRLIRVIPKNVYSRWVGRLSSVPLPAPARRPVYDWYSRRYGVRLDEVERPLGDYRSLHDFFTRHLQQGLRPLDHRPEALVSPADGRIAPCGQVASERLFQVKGTSYTLSRLLSDPPMEPRFAEGSYATVYLSPSDYHRVHFPVTGEVRGYNYVPGTLFPVNDLSVRNVDDLFTINERLTTYVETETHGLVAVIMVGAMAVGRMSVSYDRIETNRSGRRRPRRLTYGEPLPHERGDELGVFHLGSTVIVLSSRSDLVPAQPVGSLIRMGQALLLPR